MRIEKWLGGKRKNSKKSYKNGAAFGSERKEKKRGRSPVENIET